jgi:hypothetical protein
MQLKKITTTDVRRWLAAMTDEGLAPSTVHTGGSSTRPSRNGTPVRDTQTTTRSLVHLKPSDVVAIDPPRYIPSTSPWGGNVNHWVMGFALAAALICPAVSAPS